MKLLNGFTYWPDIAALIIGATIAIAICVFVFRKKNSAEEKLDLIICKLNKIMATLEQTLASVTANATVGGSIVALLTSVKAQLDAVLSGVTLPPGVQAKVDEIFNASEADKAALEAAILANTPVDPNA